MKKWLTYLCLVASLWMLKPGGAHAQQDAMYSQYMFNHLAINPAYAGSRESLMATALLRQQWISIPGAPRTQTLSLQGVTPNRRYGFGLNLINDRISYLGQTWVNLSYAFRIPLKKGNLALGLQATINNYRINWDEAYLIEQDDDILNYARSRILPNAGAGIWYSTDRWYIGGSVPHMLINSLEGGRQIVAFSSLGEDLAALTRHYFVTGGYVFKLGTNVHYKPSILLKYETTSPIEFDFNSTFLWYERLWTGVSYRTRDGIVFNMEYQFAPGLRAGYAYDYPFTRLNGFTTGSHELMLSYEFDLKRQAVVTPRFF